MEWQKSLNPATELHQHVLVINDQVVATIHEEFKHHKLEYVFNNAAFPNLETAKCFAERAGRVVIPGNHDDIH